MTITAMPAAVGVRTIELACAAPSTHNTQPWRWRLRADGVELHADPTRRLPSLDPEDRNLAISCGAALHHAVVAARSLGWDSDVTRLSPLDHPTRLAVVRLTPGAAATDEEQADLAALLARQTDRRRFTSWPVPSARLESLVAAAEAHGVLARVVDDALARFRLERLVAQAQSLQDADPTARAEQQLWLGAGRDDGIPPGVLPARDPGHPVRFGVIEDGLPDAPRRDVAGTDGVIVLGTAADSRSAWLRAGEALSSLWLAATQKGLSVVPISQPIEVPETRAELRHRVLGEDLSPHLLLRIGWQAIGRSEVPRTPRRPLADVLDDGS